MAHTAGPWFAFNADYQGRPDEAPIFVVGPGEFHTVAQVRPGNADEAVIMAAVKYGDEK